MISYVRIGLRLLALIAALAIGLLLHASWVGIGARSFWPRRFLAAAAWIVGARVRVRAGGKDYLKQNDGKSGYLSQSVLPLYFGLADAARVDAVEVAWPSGRKQIVTRGLRLNNTLRITEPK